MNKTAESQSHNGKSLNIAFKGYKDGSVDFYGEQVKGLTGYTRDDFNSKKVIWTDIIFEQDKDGVRERFIRALKTEKVYSRDYRIITKNGEMQWVQEWGQIVCDEDGSIEYVTGILVDINEQKMQEEAQLKKEEKTGKYLTFSLFGDEYGIGILKVREIIGMMPITSVPRTPAFVKGVINLRGRVIPVLDLRAKFGMEESEHTDRTCIIVVETWSGEGSIQVGIVVDSVSDVIHILGEEVEDPPSLVSQLEAGSILGMAKTQGRVKILLDIDRVLSAKEINALENAVF